MTYLSPVLPELATKTEAFLNTELTLASLDMPLVDHTIDPYKPMMTRVEPAQVDKIIETTRAASEAAEKLANATTASTAQGMNAVPTGATTAGSGPGATVAATATTSTGAAAVEIEPLKDEIEIGDFDRIDLRIATIVDAKPVDGADKLIELTLDIGNETRTVFRRHQGSL